jgi:hypothetical protein
VEQRPEPEDFGGSGKLNENMEISFRSTYDQQGTGNAVREMFSLKSIQMVQGSVCIGLWALAMVSTRGKK